MQGNRIRGVPDVRERSTTTRPAGLLSGVSDEVFDASEVLDRGDPVRAWAEGLAGSGLYGDMGADEIDAMARARESEYAANELLDRELGISLPETGNDLMAAAAADLKVRGIVFADATQEQLLAALQRVSS